MEIDNHPIPQDVSHFQFKLIGEMSVKQLGYLGAGLIFGWIFISLPVSIYIKLPIAAFYVFIGVTLAFIPIEGRPADTILYYFIKALLNPNQYVYQKSSTNSLLSSLSKHVIIHTTAVKPTPKAPVQSAQTQAMSQPVIQSTPNTTQPAFSATQPKPVMQIISRPNFSPQPAQTQPKPLHANIRLVQTPPVTQPKPTQVSSFTPAQTQPTPYASEAKTLEDAFLREHIPLVSNPQLQPVIHPSPSSQIQKQPINQPDKPALAPKQQSAQPPTQQATPIRKESEKPMMVPEFPNLISGIVKDPRGNLLPNVLITVNDKNGNPVRAFKTNQLGQFASATPIPNGTYALQLEDTTNKHKFATIELTADGKILQPVEIISTDEREELRRQLFG